jgi:hypothetical protein
MKYPKIKLEHICMKKLNAEHRQVLQEMVNKGRAATISAWVETVFDISKTLNWPGIDPEDPEEHFTFRGDALELLTEFLMKSNSLANNQGVLNFKSVPLRDDFGVDATGTKNGVNIVIQCKFKHNPLTTIRYSDLARTFAQGILKFKLDPAAKNNLWLVTTGQDANMIANEVFGSHLHVLNRNHLSRQVDGNTDFWNAFLKSYDSSL